MEPRRHIRVSGYNVDEFVWASEAVVYVDGAISPDSFEDTVARLEREGKVAHGR